MRIALFGIFGVGNIGNEASLAAMLHHVKRRLSNAEIFCICWNPSNVSKDHHIPAMEIKRRIPDKGTVLSRWFVRMILGVFRRVGLLSVLRGIRAFTHMRNVDLFIIPGTGILDDFGIGPWGMPHDLFIWCAAARLRGAKVVFSNIGAGPIEHTLSRRFMKWAAQIAHYRSFRDDISKDFMRSLSVDVSRDTVLPDLVFGLPVTDIRQELRSPTDRIIVAIGVMAYYGWENQAEKGRDIFDAYISKVSKFISWLLKNNYAVNIVIGEAADQQAVNIILRRVSKLAENHFNELVANPIMSFDDLLKEMSYVDVVVATRFHNIICALMLEKPVISVGYAIKNEVLLRDMGLGKYCQHIEKLDVDILKNDFSEVVQNLEHFRKCIHDGTKSYRNLLDAQFSKLFYS